MDVRQDRIMKMGKIWFVMIDGNMWVKSSYPGQDRWQTLGNKLRLKCDSGETMEYGADAIQAMYTFWLKNHDEARAKLMGGFVNEGHRMALADGVL